METTKVPVSIYAESTPNPGVMKFVANRMLIEADSVEFKNIEEAKASPLATKLFHFPFVKEVFISGNYVSVAKFDVIDWEDVTLEVREFIREHVADGNPILTETFIKEQTTSDEINLPEIGKPTVSVKPEELGEIEQRIVDILEEYIRPAVEEDGGNIKFKSYNDEGVVTVILQGACSGCPSSTLTLKQGIETLLQKMLPTLIKEVVAENG